MKLCPHKGACLLYSSFSLVAFFHIVQRNSSLCCVGRVRETVQGLSLGCMDLKEVTLGVNPEWQLGLCCSVIQCLPPCVSIWTS